MYGIIVDGEVKYVSCIEDFRDLIGTEIYDMMVKLWEDSEKSVRYELEQTQEILDDAIDREESFWKEARDYEKKWLKIRKENELLREELLTLKEKLGV